MAQGKETISWRAFPFIPELSSVYSYATEEYSGIFSGTEKVLDDEAKTPKLSNGNENGVGSKINTLPSPLARNVSTIIADLLRTIQVRALDNATGGNFRCNVDYREIIEK